MEIGESGIGESGNWRKWNLAKVEIGESGIGESGNWRKWKFESGIGESGIGESGNWRKWKNSYKTIIDFILTIIN